MVDKASRGRHIAEASQKQGAGGSDIEIVAKIAMEAAWSLGDQADASGFSFGSHQDALDFACNSVEDFNDRFIAQNLNGLDRYREGKAYIACKTNLWCGAHQYDLVAFRVPPGDEILIDPPKSSFTTRPVGQPHTPELERYKRAMLFGVAKLIESPKGAIPSFIGFERAKERQDFRWQILGLPGNDVGQLGGATSEREVGSFRLHFSTGNSSGVSGLIERGPEIVGGIKKDTEHFWCEPPIEANLVKICDSIAVLLNDVGPCILADERLDLPFKITDVMLCTREREFGAHKQVGHGKAP